MLTMLAGRGAKCTVAGTATPTATLKLTLAARGALRLLITLLRISVFCSVVRFTAGAVAARVDDDVLGVAVCEEEPLVVPEGVGWRVAVLSPPAGGLLWPC